MTAATSTKPDRSVIYFDLDGTLLDVRPKYFALHSHLAEKLGFPAGSQEDFWRMKRRRAPAAELLLGRKSLAPRYESLWLDLIESSEYTRLDTLLPGALEVLEEVAGSAQLVLVTLRRDPAVLRQQLARLRLAPLFAEVLVSGDHPGTDRSKPDLIQQSRWKDRRDSLLVGDTDDDAAAAASLGIPFVAVNSGLREAASLQDRAAATIESISDLPRVLKQLRATWS
jgi:phosphoglycolate phosphatase-like HAD superfamily hydrolase